MMGEPTHFDLTVADLREALHTLGELYKKALRKITELEIRIEELEEKRG